MKKPENKQYVLFGGTFVLANKMQAVADKTMHELSTKQWFLLHNLRDLPTYPLPTITTLAKEMDTSRQNVSKMLDVLQRQGYVTLRERAEDHRSQGVEMTGAGAQILHQVAKEAAPFFTELFTGISEEDCAVSAGVVVKLLENLHKMEEALALNIRR